MTKRRRSEELWEELPPNQEGGAWLTDSAEGTTVGQSQLEGYPELVGNPVNEGEGQQLEIGALVDVASRGNDHPCGNEGVLTNLDSPAVTEEGVTRDWNGPATSQQPKTI